MSHFDLIGTEREDRRNPIVPIIKIQRNQSVSIIESAGTQPPAPESGHSAGEVATATSNFDTFYVFLRAESNGEVFKIVGLTFNVIWG